MVSKNDPKRFEMTTTFLPLNFLLEKCIKATLQMNCDKRFLIVPEMQMMH